ncbi:MAG: electron transfer flavoprotein subunit beta/FixA family protein [Ardenticatenaceae bacterium]|nr:electron transfer flavoprotein subunit beta/FixA family protein [Ardenticatenaceae bacterium]HBY95311.1 electron transfer flavoprotein subunit beta [Chloroflexota bacterium]
MKIIIPMKRVPDTATKVGVRDGRVDASSLKTWVINPYDEYAIEEALRLNEQQGEGTVTIVTIGPSEAQETIRKALAMGIDAAYHLNDPAFENLDPLGRARVLAEAIEKIGEFDLIWTGWKGVDEDYGQTGIYLAELLDLPHVSMVVGVKEVGDREATVLREVEGGVEVVKTQLPAVFTQQKGEHEPRYPTLKGIMGAKKKPLTEWSASDLDLDSDELEPGIEIVEVELPPERQTGRIISGTPEEAARELVRLLREEAKVI